MNRDTREWVAVAVLGRPRGNRGELTATSLTDTPERLTELEEVFLFGDGSPYTVERVWLHEGRPIFKFLGIDTITAAEALRDAEVRIPLDARRPLESGEFFASDLVGCEVVERSTGENLGLVAAFQETGGAPLLELESGILIPFARSICVSIDPQGRRILVELPEGLKDLNKT